MAARRLRFVLFLGAREADAVARDLEGARGDHKRRTCEQLYALPKEARARMLEKHCTHAHKD